MTKSLTCLLAGLVFTPAASHAGLWDLLGLGSKPTNQVAGVPESAASLSQDQVSQGLKEALSLGVQRAISQLGHQGGFLTNLEVRIPIPPQLQKVESTLRTLKQDELAEEFVATMNHAAEQAVPEAAGVFSEAIKRMSIEDAKSILAGPDDAATRYFRSVTETNLQARFLPIVRSATSKAGVTRSYKQFVGAIQQNKYLGALGTSYFDSQSLDIDAYVTNEALDRLFKVVAREEKLIRKDPVARTTDLLQKVFDTATNKSGS